MSSVKFKLQILIVRITQKVKMMTAKRKCRQYSTVYLQYGFIPAPSSASLPMCLLCQKVFSNEAMKPSRLSQHLTKIYPDEACKDRSYFQTLWETFKKQKNASSMFGNTSQRRDDGLLASHNISLMIAREGKPHTIGEELILPSMKEVQAYWLQKQIREKYPHAWNKVKPYLIAFPSTYLVERGFSAVATILDGRRNRLGIVSRGDLRLFLSNIKPDVMKLVSLH